MSEELLQAYVMGELPPAEAAEVAAAIAADPGLQAREIRYRTIREGFRRQRVRGIMDGLLAPDNTSLPVSGPAPAAPPEKSPTSPEKPSGTRKWWLYGIVALLFVLVSGYLLTKAGQPDLPEEFFEMPASDAVASSTDDEALYVEARKQFFGERFAAAHSSFVRLRDESEGYRSLAGFYLPHASFRLGKYDRAAVEFTTALRDNNLDFGQQNLLRWNAMINRLARGEDISADLNQEWPQGFRRDELKRALNER